MKQEESRYLNATIRAAYLALLTMQQKISVDLVNCDPKIRQRFLEQVKRERRTPVIDEKDTLLRLLQLRKRGMLH